MNINVWHRPQEMRPEESGMVIAVLKSGEVKPVYYFAYEEGDFWVKAGKRTPDIPIMSHDDIKKWAYIDDLVKAAEETRAIIVLDKNDDYSPNYVINVPLDVYADDIQDIIYAVKTKRPDKYTIIDLKNALKEKYGVSIERWDGVVW